MKKPANSPKIETDLNILAHAANILHERSAGLRMYDLPGLVKSISQTLRRELDFSREARHMQIARNLMQGLTGVHVPRVYSDFSRERLLVMEYVQGRKLKEMDRGSLANAETLAKNAIKAAVKQVLVHGFFHADPHPGNLLISDGETLSLLDPNCPVKSARLSVNWNVAICRLRFEHHNLADLITILDKTFSHLTMGIIAAAMIIGPSLIITTGIPPLIMGYPVLGLLGYLISALLGLWIVFDILRSR